MFHSKSRTSLDTTLCGAPTRAIQCILGAADYERLSQVEKASIQNSKWALKNFDGATAIMTQGQERNFVTVMVAGWAFQYQTVPDGGRQILDFLLSGAVIGFGAEAYCTYGVECITNCVIASLPYPAFCNLLESCPTLAVGFAENLMVGNHRAYQHLTNIGRRTARERVAALILELISRAKLRPVKSGYDVLELPLTQILIADALGLTNGHVCRTLARLSDDGVLEFNRHALKIINPAALANEAGMDRQKMSPAVEQFALAA